MNSESLSSSPYGSLVRHFPLILPRIIPSYFRIFRIHRQNPSTISHITTHDILHPLCQLQEDPKSQNHSPYTSSNLMTEQATLDDAEMPDCKFEVEQGLGSVGPSARGRQEEILAFILALSPVCFWVCCSLSGVLPFSSRGSGVPRTGFASYIPCFFQTSSLKRWCRGAVELCEFTVEWYVLTLTMSDGVLL